MVEAFYGNAIPGGIGVRNNFLHTPSDSPEDLDAVIIVHGRIVKEAMAACKILEKKSYLFAINSIY